MCGSGAGGSTANDTGYRSRAPSAPPIGAAGAWSARGNVRRALRCARGAVIRAEQPQRMPTACARRASCARCPAAPLARLAESWGRRPHTPGPEKCLSWNFEKFSRTGTSPGLDRSPICCYNDSGYQSEIRTKMSASDSGIVSASDSGIVSTHTYSIKKYL